MEAVCNTDISRQKAWPKPLEIIKLSYQTISYTWQITSYTDLTIGNNCYAKLIIMQYFSY